MIPIRQVIPIQQTIPARPSDSRIEDRADWQSSLRDRTARRDGRAAFTLLELLVVTTLLVVLASIVVPSVTGMGRRGVLMTVSGDVLRFISDSRRNAIDAGERRWIRYEASGSTLISGPDGAAPDSTLTLPEGCEFGSHDSPERLPEVVADGLSIEQRQGAWSPEVSFYPDGTATDAEWSLKDDGGHRRTISVRGLTGRTRIRTGGLNDETG